MPASAENRIGSASWSAVVDRLRHRWSYFKGSSAQRLPGLLRQLGEIDLFVHDSRHTERNVTFELRHAWAALRPGGVMAIDDLDLNRAFNSFTQTSSAIESLICYAEPLRPDAPRFDAKGLFGIIRKNVGANDGSTTPLMKAQAASG